MILVTVGTTPFDTLIEAVDDLAPRMGEAFLCQIAGGRYLPVNAPFFRFKPTLESEMESAELVICHGGAGTLFRLIKEGKKVIAVPNLERADKHQKDLVDTLTAGNHIVSCYDLSQLENKITCCRAASLARYHSPPCAIAEEIVRFLGE